MIVEQKIMTSQIKSSNPESEGLASETDSHNDRIDKVYPFPIEIGVRTRLGYLELNLKE